MGMYTYISESDVEIIDLEGLKAFLKKIEDDEYPQYKEFPHLKEAVKIVERRDGAPMLSFEGMDGWKIISYWNDDIVMFFRDIAVFVNGTIYMDFENDDEGGRVEFEDGECIIHYGVMKWSEAPADEVLDKKIPMPEELQASKILRKL